MENDGEARDNDQIPPRKKRRWFLRLLVVTLVVLGLALVWLNGPGWRWIVPQVAEHFLEPAGMRAEFGLEGRLTGGIAVTDLKLESDSALAGMSARRVALKYRFRDLVRGRVDGLVVDGLHVELGLSGADDGGAEDEAEDEGEKQALDLKELVGTVRKARELVIPVSVEVTDLSLEVTRGGQRFLSLAGSSIRHEAGEAEIALEVGEITDAVGHVWPARESEIWWNQDDIRVNRLDPVPGLGVKGLVLRLPESGLLSAEAQLHVDDAVFAVDAPEGLTSLNLSLREGTLESGKFAGHFGIELPADGVLTSLSVRAEKLLPEPMLATGAVQLLLEDVEYDGWSVPELGLDLELDAERGSVAARAAVMGTEVLVKGEAGLTRSEEVLEPREVEGTFQVAGVAELVKGLAEKLEALDPENPVPASMLDGSYRLSFSGMDPVSAGVEAVLKPDDAELATSLAVKAEWKPEGPVTAVVELEGLAVEGNYDLEGAVYQGKLALRDFTSKRIEAWLAGAGVELPGELAVSGSWQGRGDVKAGVHAGDLSLEKVDLVRDGMPEVKAVVGMEYDWPEGFETRELKLEAAEQKVSLGLKLADGMLAMEELVWVDRETVMAGGSAKLPVPEDFAKWREMLANDGRPVEVDVESETLALTVLKDFVPGLEEKIDPRSTGKVKLRVSGSYGKPELDALVDLKNLGSPAQPKLPPADVHLKLGTRDGVLGLDGRIETPDYAPAVLGASVPFKPAEWAEHPERLMDEGFTARVDLPRVNLSRFVALVPQLKKLEGVVSGDIEAGGTIGKPVIKGRLAMSGGGALLKSDDYPEVSGMGFTVDLAMDKVTLGELKADVAGGTLRAGGTLGLDDWKPGKLDFQVRGRALPVVRNDSLIVRANADLKLAGDWERSVLSGTVGVMDSLFYQDIEILPIGKPFTHPSAAALPKVDAVAGQPTAAVPEPFSNWGLDVVARTETPFLVRGNVATGRADVNLRVGGTVGAPAPDGEVRISDFRAALPFSTLKVKSGVVKFEPGLGLDPVIEIRGIAEPRPYRVNVFVYGQASDPKLALTSNPPLPENEIMTLLATGTTTSGLEDPQAASSRGVQLLLEEFRRGRLPLGKQLRPVLGLLDQVDFSVAEEDPYSSAQYSTATFTINDNWYVTAGMGDEGESRVLGFWRFSFK